MIPGSIVLYRKFTFHDGDQADKRLVVLNSGGKKPYLVLRTTSKQKAGRLAKEGCHSKDGYYFLSAKRDHFPKDTWILLYEPYELNAGNFLQAKFAGDAEIIGQIKPETVRAIITCFVKSDDCSAHFESLLM